MTYGTIRAALLLLAMAALAASTLTASAASMNRTALGCAEVKDYDALIYLAKENDDEAFALYAINHECSVFLKDTAIIIREHAINASCIRRRGNPTCYWFANDAINERD